MKNGQMMRLAAVALLLAVMTGAAGCAAADSAEVFRYIMTGEYRNTRAQTVVIDDALMLRIPEGWELEEKNNSSILLITMCDTANMCIIYLITRNKNKVLINFHGSIQSLFFMFMMKRGLNFED